MAAEEKQEKTNEELATELEQYKGREIALQNKIKALQDPEGKLSMVATPFTQNQLLRVLQKTPREYIYKRPAKGGGQWDYVPVSYVEKVLNYTFGWMWSFEIRKQWREENIVITLGRLSIYDQTGKLLIFKDATGRHEIQLKRSDPNKGKPLDIGNDYKAADSDCLKKCASKIGVASDIYGKNEYRDIDKKYKKEKDISPGAPLHTDLMIKQKSAMIKNKKLLTKQELDKILAGKDKEKILSQLTDILDNTGGEK